MWQPWCYAYYVCGCLRCIFAVYSRPKCCNSNKTVTAKEQYRQLCAAKNNLPLFHKDWWLDIVCPNWDVAIAMNGDTIAGVWPYGIEKKIGVSLRRTPVLTPYLGPHVFYPADLKESKHDSFEHETVTALLQQMPAAQFWSVSLQPAHKQVGLYKAKGFDVQPRQTFLMPLHDDEANIFLRLHEDYRRNIRKAEAELVIADDATILPILWEYQKATLDRKDVHMHFSLPQLKALFDACKANNCCSLWVARKEGVIQAILWHIWDEERAYYLVGSKNPEAKDNRAMTALIWRAISESKKMGKTWFDFEGSMDTGVEKFFRNFGGNRELYLTIHKNSSPVWKLKTMLKG